MAHDLAMQASTILSDTAEAESLDKSVSPREDLEGGRIEKRPLSTPKSSVTQTTRKQTTCQLCGKSMLKKALLRHLRSVHHIVGQRHHCLACHETFARKDILDRHKLEQHGDKMSNGTVICLYCGPAIRERALTQYLSRQKCRKAQEERLELGSSYTTTEDEASSQGPLITPGRFDATTVLDPQFITIQFLSAFWPYKMFSEVPKNRIAEFWNLRGLVIRAMIRALSNPTEAESYKLAHVLVLIPLNDCVSDDKVFLGALVTLERRFQRSLLSSDLVRPEGDFLSMVRAISPSQISMDNVNEYGMGLDSVWPGIRAELLVGNYEPWYRLLRAAQDYSKARPAFWASDRVKRQEGSVVHDREVDSAF